MQGSDDQNATTGPHKVSMRRSALSAWPRAHPQEKRQVEWATRRAKLSNLVRRARFCCAEVQTRAAPTAHMRAHPPPPRGTTSGRRRTAPRASAWHHTQVRRCRHVGVTPVERGAARGQPRLVVHARAQEGLIIVLKSHGHGRGRTQPPRNTEGRERFTTQGGAAGSSTRRCMLQPWQDGGVGQQRQAGCKESLPLAPKPV